MANDVSDADQFYSEMMFFTNNYDVMSHLSDFNDLDQTDFPELDLVHDDQTACQFTTPHEGQQRLDENTGEGQTHSQIFPKQNKENDEIMDKFSQMQKGFREQLVAMEKRYEGSQKTSELKYDTVIKELCQVRADHRKLAVWTMEVEEALEKVARAAIDQRGTQYTVDSPGL